MTYRQKLCYGALVPAVMAAGVAQAAAVDVADVVTEISAQAASIAAIGSAVLILFVGIKAFKWVRRALS